MCRYWLAESLSSDSNWSCGWHLTGQQIPMPSEDLDALAGPLAELRPAELGGACTADLGARWMLVIADDGDLTGVVVDDFGCREVRLTDDPFVTPPGQGEQGGAVPGLLQTPDGFLAVLERVAGAAAYDD